MSGSCANWVAIWRALLAGAVVLASCSSATAGTGTGDIQPDTALDRQTIDKGGGFFNNSNFLIVPIPISNPTLGSGGALAAGMLFKTDEKSKSSLIGAGSFYTSNGSWGAAAVTDLAFDEDHYRTKASAGYANVSYDFYGTGVASGTAGRHVSLTQSGYLLQGSLATKMAPNFYIGGQARYMQIKTAFNLPDLAGDLLANGGPLSRIDNNITTIGLFVTYDSRNKDYSPSEGSLLEASFDAGLHRFVTSNVFTRAKVAYNQYDQIADSLVLASHASLCAEGGQVPIFDLCMMGAGNDLRGYPVGRYQDKAMYTLQEELRWHAFWRVGFVAFGGIGSVAPSINQFGRIFASGGAGMRFVVSKEYGVNLGLDVVVNAQGEKTFYIQVGEAF